MANKPRDGFTCEIEGCDKPRKGNGMCAAHWSANKRHGDPLYKRKINRGAIKNWISDLLATETDDCVIWPFYRDKDSGYGQMNIDNKRIIASRYICKQAHGDPENEKLETAHSCGNGHGGCVNPAHLRWATSKENNSDKTIHGTKKVGSQIANSKLDEEKVKQILLRIKKGEVLKDIAVDFGVTAIAITKIKLGYTWKHVERT